jgi:hypothetical protein
MLEVPLGERRFCLRQGLLVRDNDGDFVLTLHAGESLGFAGNGGAGVGQNALVLGGAGLAVVFDLEQAPIASSQECGTDIARMGNATLAAGKSGGGAVVRPSAVDSESFEARETGVRESIEAVH